MRNACLAGYTDDLKRDRQSLALDRTNWKFGRFYINILMLDVIHEKTCIPLFGPCCTRLAIPMPMNAPT